MIDFDFLNKCYSCGVCEFSCPQKCISYIKNHEGFINPVIEKTQCINCGLCEKNCPALVSGIKNIQPDKKIYGVIKKDYSDYLDYTSAGVFYSIASSFISNGGYVCGCLLADGLEAQHHCTNDPQVVKKMSKSKYVQSDMSFLYSEILSIPSDKCILFSGTACQIESARTLLKNRDVYYLEIICHGSPSPVVLKKYINYYENKIGKKITDITFRYKGKYGWITPMIKYEFDDGTSIQKLAFTEDAYVVGFGNDLYHKRSCYTCKYKGKDFVGDITVGDFWGCSQEKLDKSLNKGISELAINSDRGIELLKILEMDHVVFETDLSTVIKENKAIMNPPHLNIQREAFFRELLLCDKNEFPVHFMDMKRLKVRSILNKIGVFQFMKMYKYRRSHK